MIEKTEVTKRGANAEIKDPPSKTNPDVEVTKTETTKTTEVEPAKEVTKTTEVEKKD